MTLDTNLNHVSTTKEIEELISSNENVMVCCGRMGPMCIPVYEIMESIEDKYSKVNFSDMLFDAPDASFIKSLPECQSFRGLPFTVYFKNGKVVEATSSIQDKSQVTKILDKHFA